MPKFLVQLKEVCVRTTSIEVEAFDMKQAYDYACNSSYGENDFSVVKCDVKPIMIEEIQ